MLAAADSSALAAQRVRKGRNQRKVPNLVQIRDFRYRFWVLRTSRPATPPITPALTRNHNGSSAPLSGRLLDHAS